MTKKHTNFITTKQNFCVEILRAIIDKDYCATSSAILFVDSLDIVDYLDDDGVWSNRYE
jgi:hypothetical protein